MNGDVLYEDTANRLTMAAGSDPQPVESSVVPDHGKPGLVPSSSFIRISGGRNQIPYLDHNYGKPLTPPDSCSPDHPEEADTGNEEEGFTRCICGFNHDDGYMICCDKCSAWQHIECVGIKSNSVPETYLCDLCDPRPLDMERAKQIQSKKREEPTDGEEEEDGDVSDHDSDNGVAQIALSNPPSIKEDILTKGKRKKRESTRKLGQKEIKHNKRKRRKRKHISTELPVDEDTNGPWSSGTLGSNERYQEACETIYVGDLDKQSFPVSEMNSPSLLKQEQLCKVVEVQKNKKGVVVTEDTSEEQFIIECKGSLMLESKFKEDHPFFPKFYPFVLYYTKMDHLRLVMNFATYGNDARFVRRSCSPTAEVRHVVIDNRIHLGIWSRTPLAKGSELTVAFEFPFHEYRHQLDCACAQENCLVQKLNLSLAIQNLKQANGFRGKDEHGLSLLDSSLSNHMDSDSDGEDGKEKRSRKKLSREERKLEAYLRQIEKMEKTEKKRQQTTGRDPRPGILTQRNYGDEYNCDTTPSKPGKGLKKQGISHQRHQRKMQSIIRRTNRLPSCSSEPLSPEDNYSSAASTPTTPLVNVVEEHNEVQHHETPEKSFKFPKYKKGSLNDVSSSNGDHGRSNNASPETEYSSPSKSLEPRLIEIEVTDPSSQNCEGLSNLEQTVNGSVSPRTDPNTSPSPCHSTYASPTRSECVDLLDQNSRHSSASPTTNSMASYPLDQKHQKSSYLHTTLKKRWLLKYMNEHCMDKKQNGLVCATVKQINEIVKPSSSKTFPLPYKRRKLMEYQNSVNNQKLSTISVLDSQIPGNIAAMTSISVSGVCSTNVTRNNTNVGTSVTMSDVRDPLTCYQNPDARNVAGYDELSSGRSSLSSVSSNEDIRITDPKFSEIKTEQQSCADSSTGNGVKPLSSDRLSSSRGSQENLPETSTNCLRPGDERTTRDTVSQVGSSVEGSGSTTTAGGRKKVSVTEYFNRKRTSTSLSKKDSTPGHSSEVSSLSQSRVSGISSSPLSSDPVSSYRLTSSSTLSSSTYGTSLPSCVSSSTTGEVLIEPVSPDDSYHVDDDRPVLHTTSPGLRTTRVVREAKPPVPRDPYINSPLVCPVRAVAEPGSSSDAMDIEEDDCPSSSTILVNTPVMTVPSGMPRSAPMNSFGKSYSPLHPNMKPNNVSPGQPIPVGQMNDTLVPDSLRRRPGPVPTPRIPNSSMPVLPHRQEFYPASGRPPAFH